jgi:cytochrome P450
MVRLAIQDCEIGGYLVPAGCGVAMSQYVVHRDPRFFDAPEEFRPERWGNDFAKRLPKFAYFPFGGGPRICIGNSFALMETSLALATIAQKFRLSLVPGETVEPLPSITLRPKNGIAVILHER